MSSDLVPGLTVVRTYKLRWFPKDLVAGLILTTLLVPQGMAYAELAGLPPITGLYTRRSSAWRRTRCSGPPRSSSSVPTPRSDP